MLVVTLKVSVKPRPSKQPLKGWAEEPIGKTGNPFTFRVSNDRLVFYNNNAEVAYLSNNKLYITHAEVLTDLILGRFAFVPQANGNMSLVLN